MRIYERPAGTIYVIRFMGYHKIGFTSASVRKRVRQLMCAFPVPATLVSSRVVSDGFAVEKKLHKLYAKSRVKGEWFTLSKEQVIEIKHRLKTNQYAKRLSFK